MSLQTDLHSLGLRNAARGLDEFIAAAVREALSPRQVLERITTVEQEHRRVRSYESRLKKSHIGRHTALTDFDWAHPRSIDRALVEQAMALHFLDDGGGVLFFGPPGVGKTHLAKALVHQSIASGRRALFVHARQLCDDLARSETTTALERRLRHYARPHLLCIDELAYQHLDVRRLDLLYELVRRRYEARRAIVVTACLPFAQWPTVFPSTAATAALVDRLVHRAMIVNIDGDSYRRRQAEQRAAGART